MELIKDQYYHLFNRSINKEKVFHTSDNFIFFLEKYRKLDKYIDTIAYCLMPTHFHFLINIISEDQDTIRRKIGDLQSGFTKAINKKLHRTGSLFQLHTKAKLIKNEKHLISLVHYIHQNPLRANLVNKIEEWEYSSYQDYIGVRQGTLPKTDFVLSFYKNIDNFIEDSHIMINWE